MNEQDTTETAHGSISHRSDDNCDEETTTPNEMTPLFSFLTGMREDLDARLPYYKDDWSRPHSILTVVNATIFAFVVQLIPALIFAELMENSTQGHLGVAEVLLSTAIMGIIYAVAAGQPIVLMGITGPVAILLGTSYGLTQTFQSEHFAFFFWICIWAGLMHVVSAMVGLVSLVWKVTPFTSQIFELFIAITFIYSSLRDLIAPVRLGQDTTDTGSTSRSSEYASLFIGLITFYIAWTLHFAETWVYFTRQVRVFLTSYNTLLAVVVGTALSYLPGVDPDGTMPRVTLSTSPWDWQPTFDRAWLTNPMTGIDTKGIFAAMVPGFMFFLLFIIDHNVSSILTQSPKFNLQKPAAYHWDFFVLGITFIPCAMLGLPPGNGLIPQAPLHARALCTREYHTDEYGVKREVVTYIEEQRWSGLCQALLMLVALAMFPVIAWIPKGCLFGLFFYLGCGALHGNEIWERAVLCLILPKKRPAIPVVRCVNKWRTVQVFTAIQAAFALTIFAVAEFAPVGYIYPVLLTLLVPFRSYILQRWFDHDDLQHLDPYNETEEEYFDEQRAIRLAERQGSFDEEELIFPNRAEFRGQGMQRVLLNRHQRHTIGHETVGILAVDDSRTMVELAEIVHSANGSAKCVHGEEVVGADHDTTKDAAIDPSCSR